MSISIIERTLVGKAEGPMAVVRYLPTIAKRSKVVV